MTDQTGVVAVLERMRGQACGYRCADAEITAEQLIQQLDEDRTALTAVAELIAAITAERELLISDIEPPVEVLDAAIIRTNVWLDACKGGA